MFSGGTENTHHLFLSFFYLFPSPYLPDSGASAVSGQIALCISVLTGFLGFFLLLFWIHDSLARAYVRANALPVKPKPTEDVCHPLTCLILLSSKICYNLSVWDGYSPESPFWFQDPVDTISHLAHCSSHQRSGCLQSCCFESVLHCTVTAIFLKPRPVCARPYLKPSDRWLWLRRPCRVPAQLNPCRKNTFHFLATHPTSAVASVWNPAPLTPALCIPFPWWTLVSLL